MGIWESKGADIDYTLLQKKGIIKKKTEKELPYKINSKGEIDLTQPTADFKPLSEASMSNSSISNENPFNFLDNLAKSSSDSASQNDFVSDPFSGTAPTKDKGEEITAMKIKVEDLEYKLERLIDKLSMIESKLDGFEKKVF
jgi:hypothetical protein